MLAKFDLCFVLFSFLLTFFCGAAANLSLSVLTHPCLLRSFYRSGPILTHNLPSIIDFLLMQAVSPNTTFNDSIVHEIKQTLGSTAP